MLVHIERLHGIVYFLMLWIIKSFGAYNFGYYRESVLINHQGAQHYLLNI